MKGASAALLNGRRGRGEPRGGNASAGVMGGHTHNQRLDRLDANGTVNFQSSGTTVGDFHPVHWWHMCLTKWTAGLPGV